MPRPPARPDLSRPAAAEASLPAGSRGNARPAELAAVLGVFVASLVPLIALALADWPACSSTPP